jgi:iron-sulfur cluster protein
MSELEIEAIYEKLRAKAIEAISQEDVIKARARAFEIVRNRRSLLNTPAQIEEIKQKFRTIKKYSIDHLDELVKQTQKNFEALGYRVYLANNAQDAVTYTLDLLKQKPGIVVKSKSNTCKEIGLTEAIENAGISVVETDLGDRIVQLRREEGTHPLAPAIHLKKEEVAEIFSREMGREVPPDLDRIVEVAREGIRESMVKATTGITGANVIAAEGTVILVENEGNVRMVSNLPERHIVIAGINKIVPSIEDGLNIVRAESTHGTGQTIGTYVSLISGPSRTADIEMSTVLGMHGAKEVYAIFIDNGRRKAISSGFGECLYCVNCGNCLNECPVYLFLGPTFGYRYFGGVGIVFTAFHAGLDEAVKNGLHYCTLCGRCVKACPGEINTPLLVEKLLEKAAAKGYVLPTHKSLATSIETKGNPFNASKSLRIKSLTTSKRTDVLYYTGCVSSLQYRRIAEATAQILRRLGYHFTMLGEEEVCCGDPLHLTGLREDFIKIAKKNVNLFRRMKIKTIITTCPMCYKAFKYDYKKALGEFDFQVLHITEVLAQALGKKEISFSSISGKVTYHDPCHLGRHCGVYEPPRNILRSIPGLEFAEMQHLNRENAWCCGGPLRLTFPDLADAMGNYILREASALKVNSIVTACPTCLHSLSVAAPEYNLEIYDITELASKALST